ncbi:MAG: hypothetical protein KAI74_03205 [Kiritimatiellae bacterium]|nr:hypothetical protein [Kiritimatiellia bacterium]
MKSTHLPVILALALILTNSMAQAATSKTDPNRAIVANSDSLWRIRTVWETEEIIQKNGKVDHVKVLCDRKFFKENKKSTFNPDHTYTNVPVVRLPETTSTDWMQPSFNAVDWARIPGKVFAKAYKEPSIYWKAVFVRKSFEVINPSLVKELNLTVDFKGGAVVYVNGKEIKRAFMPKGKITPNSCSEIYPESAYLLDEGYIILGRNKECKTKRAARIRTTGEITIPASALKKGVNTIAVGIHRAPTSYRFHLGRVKPYVTIHQDAYWAKCALVNIKLTVDRSSAAAIDMQGSISDIIAKNKIIMEKVYLDDIPDIFAQSRPIRLIGVKNGTFAGQFVVANSSNIKNIKIEKSDLKGAGTIAASNIEIAFVQSDGEPKKRNGSKSFDSLEVLAPAEVHTNTTTGIALQPIWVRVTVPKDAKIGEYKSDLVINSDGNKPVVMPISLKVVDWTLKDSKDFTPRMDIVESPESLALAYGVKMWSEEHFSLLEKSFAQLAKLSCKSIYISAIRRTHFGNKNAMLRWYRDENGDLQPDFEIIDKYLAVATKHLGKVPGVIMYCWEPAESMGHASGTGSARRTTDKPLMITVVNKKTGRLSKRKGPAWGTPEAKVFWKKFNDGITPILKKYDLENARLYGLIGDARPTKQAMDDITSGFKNAKWAVHSHHYCVEWKGYEIGMAIALWGIGSVPVDPTVGYGFGWTNPFWIMYYPRELSMNSSLVEQRTKLEKWMGAKARSATAFAKSSGTRGLGRLGADFFQVDIGGNRKSYICGRYPESAWGQLNLSYCVPNILGQGKTGPVATVRSETFRENIQEVEARIFIEKALLDKAHNAKLGKDLSTRCRKNLDKRIRMSNNADGPGEAWFISSGWQNRMDELFTLASEVEKTLNN